MDNVVTSMEWLSKTTLVVGTATGEVSLCDIGKNETISLVRGDDLIHGLFKTNINNSDVLLIIDESGSIRLLDIRSGDQEKQNVGFPILACHVEDQFIALASVEQYIYLGPISSIFSSGDISKQMIKVDL